MIYERSAWDKKFVDEQVITCICAHCGRSRVGKLKVTREWFKYHGCRRGPA